MKYWTREMLRFYPKSIILINIFQIGIIWFILFPSMIKKNPILFKQTIQYWNILICVEIKSCKWESKRSHFEIVYNISICIIGSCMKCCCVRNICYLFIIRIFMFDLPWGLRYIVIGSESQPNFCSNCHLIINFIYFI